MRHEASRSRGARLLDNLFGRIKKQVYHDETNEGGGLASKLTSSGRRDQPPRGQQ